MEVQIVVSEISLGIINEMDVSGKNVEEVAHHKMLVQTTLQTQKLIVAAIKERIKIEEKKKEVN